VNHKTAFISLRENAKGQHVKDNTPYCDNNISYNHHIAFNS